MYLIKAFNPRIKKLGELFDISIWLVDGNKIKDWGGIKPYIGGSSEVFDYIPENEIWVSNKEPESKRFGSVLHELVERHLMKTKDMSYSKAHHIAWKAEGIDEGTEYVTPEAIEEWLKYNKVKGVTLDKHKGIININGKNILIRSVEDLENLGKLYKDKKQ